MSLARVWLGLRMKLSARCVALAITFFHIVRFVHGQALRSSRLSLTRLKVVEAFGSSESRLRQQQVSARVVTAL
ncbi:Hypothetical predicted protein, partial [Prunus dulcis]